MRHGQCTHKTRVVDSRARDGRVWRRRECLKCLYGFTTFEITEKELEKLMDAETRLHELDGPNWAVIAFRGVVETEVTYVNACAVVKALDGTPGNGGLAIVSKEAAARLNGRTPLRKF